MNENDYVTSAVGVRLPRILYGTAWKEERTAGLVEQAVTLGFRGIDTACQPKHYNEAGVGEGLARCFAKGLRREDVYLQSKFTPLQGQDPERVPYDPKARLADQVAQSFETSLRNLRTDHLDGLVLHSPLADEASLMEVWGALEAVCKSGGARQIGISNCYALETLTRLYDLAEVKPALIQNRFYADTGYDREIRRFCRQKGLIYQSFWTLTANPKVLAGETLQNLANKYARSAAQVFYRYLTLTDIIPLSGTTRAQHMQDDLAIFDFELTPAECASVGRLLDREPAAAS
ncbi:aldo/keto reductase [Methylococcus sp. EFPC2]|uniref:aldo/keto reductase family protein n=1 Tax=Methylococcus sp. EFPC2 TaxID=2812648 RepID=UPI0019686CFD|nr:aldo/keto reductase [Methylococcus sp. EFPC2]QSA97429.1 aldo/keto reductase [Methylococcus sp. EFPC2]